MSCQHSCKFPNGNVRALAGKYSGHFVSSLCHTHTYQIYLKDNGNLHLLVGGRNWVYVFEKSSYAVPIC